MPPYDTETTQCRAATPQRGNQNPHTCHLSKASLTNFTCVCINSHLTKLHTTSHRNIQCNSLFPYLGTLGGQFLGCLLCLLGLLGSPNEKKKREGGPQQMTTSSLVWQWSPQILRLTNDYYSYSCNQIFNPLTSDIIMWMKDKLQKKKNLPH